MRCPFLKSASGKKIVKKKCEKSVPGKKNSEKKCEKKCEKSVPGKK